MLEKLSSLVIIIIETKQSGYSTEKGKKMMWSMINENGEICLQTLLILANFTLVQREEFIG